MAPIEFNRWLGVGEVRMNKDYALVEGDVLEVQRRTTSLVGAGGGEEAGPTTAEMGSLR